MAALSGGTPVTDVTLTGNVTWISGPDKDVGSATLMAKGSTETRMDLVLSGGKRSEIRNIANGLPQGAVD
jgi:hypothetical protein